MRAYRKRIPDPRRRQGRIYPLEVVRTMLLLAAVNGPKSLRGMGKGAQAHREPIRSGLGVEGLPHPPEYGA